MKLIAEYQIPCPYEFLLQEWVLEHLLSNLNVNLVLELHLTPWRGMIYLLMLT